MNRLRGAFDEPAIPLQLRLVASLSVMAGSLLTIWPFIAAFPILPPAGLMMLLAWRLRRPDALPVWAPVPLGLFDDLISGQPIGSAILLWTLTFFAIDLVERRLMFRDFWQDWLVAAGGIAACLALGRLIASPLGAHVDTVVIVQIVLSILLYPVAASLAGWLDSRRAQT